MQSFLNWLRRESVVLFFLPLRFLLADWVVKTKKQVVKLYAVTKWARDAGTVQKCMVRCVSFILSLLLPLVFALSFLFVVQLHAVLYVLPVLSTHPNDASSHSLLSPPPSLPFSNPIPNTNPPLS
jgi:hypothetical protein